MSLRIKNNERFLTCLKYLNKGDNVADIGCDHGYLGIQALIDKEVSFVEFIDNKKEPLNQALKNIKKCSLNENTYSLSLSSGLNDLKPSINKIVMMGMGGELICEIIDEDINKISNEMILILEANSKIDFLRKYLYDHSFDIIDEDMTFENNKYYEFLIVKKTPNLINYNDYDLMFGKHLLKKKDQLPIFKSKWSEVLKKYQDINSRNPQIGSELMNKIKMIEEIL